MNAREDGNKLKRVSEQFGSGTMVLLSCPDTITYATGIEFPFPASFPERPIACLVHNPDSALLVCPHEWGDAAKQQGWQGVVETYGDAESDSNRAVADLIAANCASAGTAVTTIHYEADAISYDLLIRLQDLCTGIQWQGAEDKIRQMRLQKSDAEAAAMRTAAEQLEFGLIGAIQHLEGSLEENGYTLSEFCERIRVHVYETGGTASGLSAVAAGRGLQQWYGTPEGKFTPGELVRIEASSRYYGYWANTARMMVIGDANELQRRAYRENLLLKQTAASMLNPGVKCAAVFDELVQTAAEKGIEFRSEFGAGHGIGTGEREAPFLTAGDETVLRAGMCIVLAIYTEGPQKELVCTKDTYYLRETGPVCLSSFHNWDVLYEINGFRSAH